MQERGIYFWGNFDSKYTPVLGLTYHDEPETKGSLVYAKYGKGLYIFTGLSFFRRTSGRGTRRVSPVRESAQPVEGAVAAISDAITQLTRAAPALLHAQSCTRCGSSARFSPCYAPARRKK